MAVIQCILGRVRPILAWLPTRHPHWKREVEARALALRWCWLPPGATRRLTLAPLSTKNPGLNSLPLPAPLPSPMLNPWQGRQSEKSVCLAARKQSTPMRTLQVLMKRGELARLRFFLLTMPWRPLLPLLLPSLVVAREGAGALGEEKRRELPLLPSLRRRQTQERALLWRLMQWLEPSAGVGLLLLLLSQPRPLLLQHTLRTRTLSRAVIPEPSL